MDRKPVRPDTNLALIETFVRADSTTADQNRAFGQIVARFQDMAFGSAYAILGDYQHAEDVTQDAFLSAYRNMRDLRDPMAFPGWLQRIVRTQCHRLLRRKSIVTVGIDARLANLPDSGAADPEAVTLKQERARCVHDALATLPEAERSVVVLFHINDYTRGEIARFLDVSPIVVKKRLAKARARLKEKLIDMLEEDLREQRPSKDEAFAARLTAFTKLFSALIEEGTSLVHSLESLSREESDPAFRAVIDDIDREILRGNSLSAAMAQHAAYFDDTYIAAIREGELKGVLEVVLRELASGTYVPNAILGYSDQFGDISRAVYTVAGKYKTVAIEPEHYLLGLLTPPENDASERLTQLGVDVASLRADVQEYLSTLPRKTGNDWSKYSPALTAISDTAYQLAKESSAAEVTPLHYLTAFVRAEGTPASRLLHKFLRS